MQVTASVHSCHFPTDDSLFLVRQRISAAGIVPYICPAFIFASILPVSTATVFLYRECGWHGVRDLWKRIFEYRQIADKRWLFPTVLLMPATMVASYFSMRMMGKSIPDSHISIFIAPVLFVVFFVFAIGEEGGWSGYVIDGLQNRWTALTSSIALGSVWAAWHIVPYVQAHHSSNWWVVWVLTIGSG
jgi:membrane protease YdiL (CAAX protease family)